MVWQNDKNSGACFANSSESFFYVTLGAVALS